MRFSSLPRALHLAVWCAGLLSCSKQVAAPPPPLPVLTNAGQYDRAVVDLVQSYIDVARSSPTDAVRRRDIALAMEANSMWADSVPAWESAIALAPTDQDYRYHQAFCLYKLGEPAEARVLLEAIVIDYPVFPAAQYLLGLLLIEEGRFEAARERLRVTDLIAAGHPGPPNLLAEVEFHFENYAEAEELARRSLAIAPDFRPAHFTLGKTLRAMGRLEEAQRELDQGMEAKPAYLPTSLTKLRDSLERGFTKDIRTASQYLDEGRADKAVEVLVSLVERYPEELPAWINLGVAYTHAGQPAKAKEVLLTAIEMDPNHFGAYLNLAAAEIDLGELLDAMTHVNQSIAAAPDIGRAYVVRAQIYTQMGRDEDAYRALLKAQSLDTTDAQVLAKLGSCAWKLNKQDEALNYFRSCVALDTSNIGAHLNIAKIYITQGRSQEATEAYNRARAVNPESPLVKDFDAWWKQVSQQAKAR